MNAAVVELVAEIEQRGGRLTLTGAGRVKCQVPGKLKHLLEPLREHREAVAEYLRRRQGVSIGRAAEILGGAGVTPDVSRPCSHCRGGKRPCRCDLCQLRGHCTVCGGTGHISQAAPPFDPDSPGYVAYRAGTPIQILCIHCGEMQQSRRV